MLDPVADGAAGRRHLGEGVQDVLDGGAADGVGGDLHAGLGQDADRFGVVAGVLPVRGGGLAVAVGFMQR